MGVLLLGALAYLVVRRGAGREERVEPLPERPSGDPAESRSAP